MHITHKVIYYALGLKAISQAIRANFNRTILKAKSD